MADEALEAALAVIEAFEDLGVEYLVVGSLASSFHGVPRSTQDADLVASLEPRHVRTLVSALEGEFYLDEDRIRSQVARHASFNLIFLRTMYKVDVFVPGDDPLSREQMRRRQRVVIDEKKGLTIDFASPEDTVLQKLAWYRKGGEVSDRQWQDLLGVLKVNRDRLDTHYLNRWAPHLGMEDLLARALDEADIGA